MSAIAGRVLILPKGDYDASTMYEFLDLVNHNSSSWLAKKASQGIEPSDTNAEFWQKFGSSVTPDGVTIVIDENGVVSAVGGTAEKVTYENESVVDVANVKEALDGIFDGTQLVGDSAKLGGKGAELYALLTDLANYLPLSGGTVAGKNDSPMIIKNTVGANSYVGLEDKDGNKNYIGFENGVAHVYGKGYILHTGNKPTGTYTGNGSATSRTVETGGIGDVCIINSTQGVAIVTEYGAIVKTASGTSVTGLASSNVKFIDGVLTIASNSPYVNSSSVEYTYQVV